MNSTRMASKVLDALTYDGGPGSGDFGHEGRPGEVGGSGSGGVSSLPALKGSEKQIAWAETIREKQLSTIDKLVQLALEHDRLHNDTPEAQEIHDAVNKLRAMTDSHVWIENRTADPVSLLRSIAYRSTVFTGTLKGRPLEIYVHPDIYGKERVGFVLSDKDHGDCTVKINELNGVRTAQLQPLSSSPMGIGDKLLTKIESAIQSLHKKMHGE